MRRLYYSLNLLVLTSIFINVVIAQSGIVHVGGNAVGSEGSVSFTIGQIDYLPVSSQDGNLSPGVQQVFDDVGVGIPTIKRTVDIFNVYPNPNSGIFTLELLNDESEADIMIEIYGIHGNLIKLLKHKKITLHTIDISSNPSGVYYLRVIHENESTVFKILKE